MNYAWRKRIPAAEVPVWVLVSVAPWQCTSRTEKLFQPLESGKTAIDFANTLAYTNSTTGWGFEYLYNEAGMAVGIMGYDFAETKRTIQPDVYAQRQ
jgi:hypothetical protein